MAQPVLEAILYVCHSGTGDFAGKPTLSRRSSASEVSSVCRMDHDFTPVTALLHVAMGVARLLQREDPVHVDLKLTLGREIRQLPKVAPRIVAQALHELVIWNP